MHDPITYFAETFADTKVAKKWVGIGEAKGKKLEAISIAQNMVNLGLPLEVVVSATKLAPKKVKSLYKDLH